MSYEIGEISRYVADRVQDTIMVVVERYFVFFPFSRRFKTGSENADIFKFLWNFIIGIEIGRNISGFKKYKV